eukprot:scaffold28955_cov139-Isochrysis_galbana.AAC.1
MGDPALYPEIRTARFLYAMQWLPRDFTADYQARQQWIDNNLTYLDGLVIANLHYHDADFRRDTWSTYHNLHMCRLGVCPVCFNPQLPNPQIFPARSIAAASAQFQVRDPTVEREGPVTPLYGPFDCWQPPSTPLTHLVGLPVHPTHIPHSIGPDVPSRIRYSAACSADAGPISTPTLRLRRKYLVMFIPR